MTFNDNGMFFSLCVFEKYFKGERSPSTEQNDQMFLSDSIICTMQDEHIISGVALSPVYTSELLREFFTKIKSVLKSFRAKCSELSGSWKRKYKTFFSSVLGSVRKHF